MTYDDARAQIEQAHAKLNGDGHGDDTLVFDVDPPSDLHKMDERASEFFDPATHKPQTPTDEELGNWKPDDFSFRTLAREYPRLHAPLVHGLFRKMETANVISLPKIGKSWLCYGLALSIITGRPWLGRFQTEPGRVLLVDNELHRPTIVHRVQTVAEAMGLRPEDYADALDVWALRGALKSIDELMVDPPRKIEFAEFALIILDAKYRFILDDENSNSAETRFYNTVDRWSEQTGAAISMTHHATKGNQGEKRITDIGAGGGAQSRAADCHIAIREHEQDDLFVLEAAVRSFPRVEPVGLRLEWPLWIVQDGIDTEKLKGRKLSGDDKQKGLDMEADNLVIDACDTWRSLTELKRQVGFGSGRLDRALLRLTKAGLLETQEQERKGNQCTAYRKTIHAR